MKKFLVFAICLVAIPSFANISDYINPTADYELIDGDMDCPLGISLSNFEPEQLIVNEIQSSRLIIAFSEINQGTSKKVYGQGESKVCYSNEYKDGELISYRSDYISPFRPCFFADLKPTHKISFSDDLIQTYIYQKACEYQKVQN
ncbi:MAG: hypothetical protein MK008_12445 [Bdellovibrionales bacterium]|nr:hypothetical protein [Bdellovibrionales bacterium]